LGLAAQHHEIEQFGGREGFAVRSWYQDVQTEAGADALPLDPGLAAALKEARAARCSLIVWRLDRLSRNVHFITGLMEQGAFHRRGSREGLRGAAGGKGAGTEGSR
jgi:DNA invertase Pin-like site-specific DNA recombinase